MSPRLISGCPILAVSAAILSVHAMASSQPPPSAKPLMAAITGFPRFSMRSNRRCPMSEKSRPPAAVCSLSSLMSAPATKALSPAPVTMTTRRLSSAENSAIAASSSLSIARFSAFSTCGLLNVTRATARSVPSRSTTIVSGMGERIHQPAHHDGDDDEPDEHQPAETRLLAEVVLGDDREDERDEERE